MADGRRVLEEWGTVTHYMSVSRRVYPSGGAQTGSAYKNSICRAFIS